MSHLLAFPAFSLSHTALTGLFSFLPCSPHTLSRHNGCLMICLHRSCRELFRFELRRKKREKILSGFFTVTSHHATPPPRLHVATWNGAELQTHHVPATLGCGVFGGGHSDFKHKTLKKHRKRDVSPWFTNKCDQNKAPLFPAETLGSIVGTNPTLYHMTGPFHHWNIGSKLPVQFKNR